MRYTEYIQVTYCYNREVKMVKKKNQRKKIGCLIPSLVFIWLTLIVFVGIYLFTPRLKELSVSADTTQTYDVNSNVVITLKTIPENFKIPDSAFKTSGGKLNFENDQIIFTSSKPGKFSIRVAFSDIKSNKLTLKFEDKEAIEQAEQERIAQEQAEQERIAQEAEQARIAQEQAEQTRIAQEQAEQARIAQEQAEQARIAQEQNQPTTPQERMVWIPATGEKYHSKPDCGRMDKNRASYISLSEAQNRGYTPCSKCSY